MKRSTVFLLLLLVPVFGSFTQSNDLIDVVLKEKSVNLSESLYFCLISTGDIDENADFSSAYQKGKELGLVEGRGPDYVINVGDLAYLIGRTFKIQGGLMYTLFPGTRYYLREMLARKIIAGRPTPESQVEGHDLLTFVGRAASFKEGK